ncbi:hypothetical protein [Bacillus cereus]
MKGIISLIKKKMHNIWFFHRIKVYVGIGVILLFVILSFFIDIGYILTILAVFGMIQFSKSVSKQDPDVLKIDANKRAEEQRQIEHIKKELNKELSFLESYIENNPTDFVAWRRKAEIEDILKDF